MQEQGYANPTSVISELSVLLQSNLTSYVTAFHQCDALEGEGVATGAPHCN